MSTNSLPDIASASPARFQPHPFKKVIGTKPHEIMASWRQENEAQRVTRSAPDIALRHPSPVTAVFEGKYFRIGGVKAAETALVTSLYQAFFYLGLSNTPSIKDRPAWEYEYSCLLAYDASEGATLQHAWLSIPENVRDAFWNGANIYVMILGGKRQ